MIARPMCSRTNHRMRLRVRVTLQVSRRAPLLLNLGNRTQRLRLLPGGNEIHHGFLKANLLAWSAVDLVEFYRPSAC